MRMRFSLVVIKKKKKITTMMAMNWEINGKNDEGREVWHKMVAINFT